MPDVSLVEAIREDHQSILEGVREIRRRSSIDREAISKLSLAVGAHHLAEEDTLYDVLSSVASARVGEARAYHIVLDDLTHAIERGPRIQETTRDQVRLLEQLLRHHFRTEESELLEILPDNLTAEDLRQLGRTYRRRYRDNLATIGTGADPQPALDVADSD